MAYTKQLPEIVCGWPSGIPGGQCDSTATHQVLGDLEGDVQASYGHYCWRHAQKKLDDVEREERQRRYAKRKG